MANRISYKRNTEAPSFKMSNGLTSAFIKVLCLAASELAETDHEREFAIWIASHDQDMFGIGTVSFGVCELPWCIETFGADVDFVLRVIGAAKAKCGWERLRNEPTEDWIMSSLEEFRKLIEMFDIRDIVVEDSEWRYDHRPFQKCPKHLIYRYFYGCVMCHDEGVFERSDDETKVQSE